MSLKSSNEYEKTIISNRFCLDTKDAEVERTRIQLLNIP